jgi:hypothetical protein
MEVETQTPTEIEYDTATLRFLLERFIPPGKTAMDLNVNSPEEFDRAIEQAREECSAKIRTEEAE